MTQTIQRTSKKWKLLMLVGNLVSILGFIGLFTGDPSAGVTILVAGIVLHILGRIGAWWSNG